MSEYAYDRDYMETPAPDRYTTPEVMGTPQSPPDSRVTGLIKDHFEDLERLIGGVYRTLATTPSDEVWQLFTGYDEDDDALFSVLIRLRKLVNSLVAGTLPEPADSKRSNRYDVAQKVFGYVHALTLLLYHPKVWPYLFRPIGDRRQQAVADSMSGEAYLSEERTDNRDEHMGRTKVIQLVHQMYTDLGRHFSTEFVREVEAAGIDPKAAMPIHQIDQHRALRRICGDMLGGMPSVYMWATRPSSTKVPEAVLNPDGVLTTFIKTKMWCPPVILGYLDPVTTRLFAITTRAVKYPLLSGVTPSASNKPYTGPMPPVLLRGPLPGMPEGALDMARKRLFAMQATRATIATRVFGRAYEEVEPILGWYAEQDKDDRVVAADGSKQEAKESHPSQRLGEAQEAFAGAYVRRSRPSADPTATVACFYDYVWNPAAPVTLGMSASELLHPDAPDAREERNLVRMEKQLGMMRRLNADMVRTNALMDRSTAGMGGGGAATAFSHVLL